MTKAHWQTSRNVVERIIVTGDLVLETPANLRNGDADEMTDMPLLLDPLTGKALLTGTSLAGALRSYLREYELGYGQKAKAKEQSLYALLFGGLRDTDTGEQSPLITCDARSKVKPDIELRDGVQLDNKTRTAKDKKRFDTELLAAGTTFPIRLELLVIQNDDEKMLDREQKLRQALALALQGFEQEWSCPFL